MKKNFISKGIRTRIDIISLEIIEKMIRNYNIPADVAERKFRQSIIYKILMEPSNNFYLKSSNELFDILTQEFQMNEYLNSQIKPASNNLEQIKNQMIREITKKFSILNDVSIEESFYSLIHSSYYQMFTQKDILDYLEDSLKTYQTFQKEINLSHRNTKIFNKIKKK